MPILSARTMTLQRDASISAWSVRAAAGLFSAFGVLALLLATIGVYGLKAYDVRGGRVRSASAWRSARPAATSSGW